MLAGPFEFWPNSKPVLSMGAPILTCCTEPPSRYSLLSAGTALSHRYDTCTSINDSVH